MNLWNHCSQIFNSDRKIIKEVVIKDKTATGQMRLIQQLDEEDKQTIFRLIEKMLKPIGSSKASSRKM
jgi:hypothetical protein